MCSKDRVIGTLNDGEIEFVIYQPEHYDGFKDVLWNGYFPGECVANGIGLNLPDQQEARDEMTELCTLSMTDQMSIVARVAATKQIVGHVVNKIQPRHKAGDVEFFESFANNRCRTATGREYLRNASFDVFAHNECDSALVIMFLGVSPAYARRSIGLKLVELSLQLAREARAGYGLERLPESMREPASRLGCAFGVFASNYSKSIAERLGFETHVELWYDQMEFAGKKLQERIPNPLQRSLRFMSVPISV